MEGGKPGWNDAMNGLPGEEMTSVYETLGDTYNENIYDSTCETIFYY